MKYKKVCETCAAGFITLHNDFLLCYPCWKNANVRRDWAEKEIFEKGFWVSIDEFLEFENWKLKKQLQYYLDRDENIKNVARE